MFRLFGTINYDDDEVDYYRCFDMLHDIGDHINEIVRERIREGATSFVFTITHDKRG